MSPAETGLKELGVISDDDNDVESRTSGSGPHENESTLSTIWKAFKHPSDSLSSTHSGSGYGNANGTSHGAAVGGMRRRSASAAYGSEEEEIMLGEIYGSPGGDNESTTSSVFVTCNPFLEAKYFHGKDSGISQAGNGGYGGTGSGLMSRSRSEDNVHELSSQGDAGVGPEEGKKAVHRRSVTDLGSISSLFSASAKTSSTTEPTGTASKADKEKELSEEKLRRQRLLAAYATTNGVKLASWKEVAEAEHAEIFGGRGGQSGHARRHSVVTKPMSFDPVNFKKRIEASKSNKISRGNSLTEADFSEQPVYRSKSTDSGLSSATVMEMLMLDDGDEDKDGEGLRINAKVQNSVSKLKYSPPRGNGASAGRLSMALDDIQEASERAENGDEEWRKGDFRMGVGGQRGPSS